MIKGRTSGGLRVLTPATTRPTLFSFLRGCSSAKGGGGSFLPSCWQKRDTTRLKPWWLPAHRSYSSSCSSSSCSSSCSSSSSSSSSFSKGGDKDEEEELNPSKMSPQKIQELRRKYFEKLAGGPQSPILIAESTEGRGRAVFARHDIPKGQLITAERPFLSYPLERVSRHHDPTAAATRCTHCLSSLPSGEGEGEKKVVRCGLTGDPYCSENCQAEAWREYQEAVATTPRTKLERFEDHCRKDGRLYPMLAMRTMARILLDSRNTGGIENTWLPLQTLGFCQQVPPNIDEDYKVFEECFLQQPQNRAFFDKKWYTRVMQILYINAMNIELPSKTSSFTRKVGGALYITSSFYNHSCVPNAETLFPAGNNVMHVRARDNIPAGEEIFITYLSQSTIQNYQSRRSHLYTHYGFWCECPKCRVEKELEERQQNQS